MKNTEYIIAVTMFSMLLIAFEIIMMMKRKGTWEKISMRRCMPRSNMPPKYPIIIPKVMPMKYTIGR